MKNRYNCRYTRPRAYQFSCHFIAVSRNPHCLFPNYPLPKGNLTGHYPGFIYEEQLMTIYTTASVPIAGFLACSLPGTKLLHSLSKNYNTHETHSIHNITRIGHSRKKHYEVKKNSRPIPNQVSYNNNSRPASGFKCAQTQPCAPMQRVPKKGRQPPTQSAHFKENHPLHSTHIRLAWPKLSLF